MLISVDVKLKHCMEIFHKRHRWHSVNLSLLLMFINDGLFLAAH